MAEKLTQLLPVDVEKQYPQWGTEKRDASGNLVGVDFFPARQPDSDRFRETHGGFDQAAPYEVWVMLPGFPDPFKSRSLGSALAPNDANGQPTERQANYPFAQIGQLPIYYLVTQG